VDVQMTHIDRVLGICLIHATGTTPGLLGSLKDKVSFLVVLQSCIYYSVELTGSLPRWGIQRDYKINAVFNYTLTANSRAIAFFDGHQKQGVENDLQSFAHGCLQHKREKKQNVC